jgi:hypothetical protein
MPAAGDLNRPVPPADGARNRRLARTFQTSMPRREDPRRWAVAALATAVLLGGLLQVPEDWFEAFFSPLDLRPADLSARPPRVLRLLPVPVIETAPPPVEDERDERPRPPEPELGDWWRSAWQARLEVTVAPWFGPAPRDTALARALELLGDPVTADILAASDSTLAARLAFLRLNDALGFEQARGRLLGVLQADRYRRILNQAARLHGEWLLQEIEVTDAPGDRRR